MLRFRGISRAFRVPSPCREPKVETTRWLTAKVARVDRFLDVARMANATFMRVRLRVVSAAVPLGEAMGFSVSPEGPDVVVLQKDSEDPTL